MNRGRLYELRTKTRWSQGPRLHSERLKWFLYSRYAYVTSVDEGASRVSLISCWSGVTRGRNFCKLVRSCSTRPGKADSLAKLVIRLKILQGLTRVVSP
ncbi:hypothetical protein NEUTE1DRAFT_49219 [Neurospora tetrasperma FGSC 2508]|uniref:Uncharacterized protein n=1 Tax=Neurospora tetrasperma (strain FGSC 2508 / ATCC MYA-4615 / P0657) TaxID=510951 RepID=F8MX14_NEUT8|nr:uncharacterized protein NEUTE1DRAFT_49219 [Neurospora tetrasperma FGSC 2508]EGO54285.1 hypothetical protein NEUTE1DRAFT_49219 [Neurospora tetrasperma FGSC 2508]EGZ68279.1 hypothetical protein NEUTE2DRAFT_73478 [Neurospora tetrasperma FGSC 2509]